MMAAIQAMMGTTDLMSLKPVSLPTDSAAIRARRIVEDAIRHEAEAVAAE